MSEQVRVGVFVCDCGTNIAGVVDVPAVTEYARGLDHVVLADEGRWSCSVDYLSRLQELIREHELNRVVIASCTPRTHEPLFKATVREAGLNPYLLEFVSIREQVSWVHMDEPESATQKAKDLVRMGVAKAVLLEEGEEIRLPVKTECLIIGGGIAGMMAALHVAEQGFQAVLVEQQPQLGGLLNRLCSVVQDDSEMPAAEIVDAVRARVEAHPQIEIHRSTRIESVEGYIGNYKVKLNSTDGNGGDPQSRDISTIIVATGMRELDPAELYDYDSESRVITQLELEQRINNDDVGALNDVVIINCVGSRNEERGCCNVGCLVSIKNALAIKAANPEARVHVLHRDLNLLRNERHHLERAKGAGVRFLRFADDEYPRLNRRAEGLEIEVRDVLLDKTLTLPTELLVLTTGFQGCDGVEHLKGQLKVSASKDSFFQEAHIKLGPLDFPSDGISLCGCAKGPKTLKESVEEGIGAAMRVSIPMKRGYIEAEGIVADVDLENCEQCGLCVTKCPYGAIVANEDQEPSVIKALCKGCGLCAADCPMDCFTLVHYTDEQLQAQVEEALAESPGDKIVGFVCHWCALGGVDMAGVSRLQYPTNGRLIRVMCSARVPTKLVERAFELGAGGVLVAGCEFPTCHYITGNYECETRMKRARRKLAKKGYDTGKLWNLWCSAADGPKFAKAMTDMVEQLGLGRETKGE